MTTVLKSAKGESRQERVACFRMRDQAQRNTSIARGSKVYSMSTAREKDRGIEEYVDHKQKQRMRGMCTRRCKKVCPSTLASRHGKRTKRRRRLASKMHAVLSVIMAMSVIMYRIAFLVSFLG